MLILCPECSKEISDKAISCPNCGYPMQPIKIRRQNKKKRPRLPNGFGQISEIKNKNLRKPFRAMISVGTKENGRPICKLLQPEAYFATYNEAYEALVKYHTNPYDLDKNITLEELYNRWFSVWSEKRTDVTVRTAINAWKACAPIQKMKVRDIRSRHIKGILDLYQLPTKKVRIKTLFNQLFDYAMEYELVDTNYPRNFKINEEILEKVKTTDNPHQPFTDAEINILWDNSENVFVRMILIQCYMGWRPNEVCELFSDNVDLKRLNITGGSKTDAGKNRVVPIHPSVLNIIQEQVANRERYLFTYKGNPITYVKYKYWFYKLLEDLGLNKNHRLHDGRKHFITAAKKYEVDEYAIKYIVGHKISDLTERVYTDRDEKWLHEEIQKIK